MPMLSLIWRQFRILIIFLILEAIAIWLLLSLNVYQNSYFFQTINELRSNFLSSFSLIDDYFSLYSENKKLVNENTRLTEQLKNTFHLCTYTSEGINSKYHYIPAKVSYGSIGMPENILVVNQGRQDGIKAEMAVSSSSGLVGIVYAVSEDYAAIMPLVNTSFSCLVSVAGHTLSANTSWDGRDYRYIQVKGIPLHLSIQKNDSVFTNINSTLYPPNELIGTVVSVAKEDLGRSFALKVKLATDFSTLQNVYIIENRDRAQIDSLLHYE